MHEYIKILIQGENIKKSLNNIEKTESANTETEEKHSAFAETKIYAHSKTNASPRT